MSRWSTPEDLREQLERRWRRGELLASRVTGVSPFPMELRVRGPSPRELTDDLGAVRAWVQELRAAERGQRGHGFELRWKTVRNRVHGSNEIPDAALVPSADDALRMLRRRRDAERFDALVVATRARCPALVEWLTRRPLTALEHADEWPQLLAVVAYFQEHPRPGLYVRQLDIPGVDTKLIEQRRRLLAELLDEALPAEAVAMEHTGARGFESRYGLRSRPARVRLRLLDPGLRHVFHGLEDLAAPVEQLACLAPERWSPPLKRVFVTENEINGLAFPECPGAAVIFGHGYAAETLAELPWLHRVPVAYWGDIDTHGFAILDRLRAHLPEVRSLLMDHETLTEHRHLCVEEPAERRFTGDLARLSDPESALFEQLRDDHLGERLRLEQERIGYGWARERIERALA